MFWIKPTIKRTARRIKKAMRKLMLHETREKHCIIHWYAKHIHPKRLVIWICVQSDAEKYRLVHNTLLMKKFMQLLVEYEYPEEGRSDVFIGFESQETVDRVSDGHWWIHWGR